MRCGAEATKAIDSGEASVTAVQVDQLDASQQQRLAIAQILFREAREALLADDFARASTLAGKARVLVEELPTE